MYVCMYSPMYVYVQASMSQRCIKQLCMYSPMMCTAQASMSQRCALLCMCTFEA
jgi:hypothetical protein